MLGCDVVLVWHCIALHGVGLLQRRVDLCAECTVCILLVEKECLTRFCGHLSHHVFARLTSKPMLWTPARMSLM